MSSISSINNSLTSSLLSSLEQSGSASSTGTGPLSTGIDSDIVSLLSGSSPETDDSSLYSALFGSGGSTSTGSLYDILLSAGNASLMESDPTLVNDIIAAGQTSTSSGSSSGSTSTESLVQQLQNINLLTISPDALLSLIQNSSSGSTSTGSTSTVSTTA